MECWFVMVDVRRCWTLCWLALMVVGVGVLFGWCSLVGDGVLVDLKCWCLTVGVVVSWYC